jgi:uncharacterized repeat protein (TIGR03803 family)
MRHKKSFYAAKSTLAIFVTLLLALAVIPTQARAQKFKVLHTFHGKDGDGPTGQLVLDKSGNIYETTFDGGTGKCQIGCGTALKMNSAGKIIWTHSFDLSNGWSPLGGLLRDATGNLFGTTVYGGKTNGRPCSPNGCGLVFELGKTGKKETILHRFTGEQGGYFPDGPVAADAEGNLYGVNGIGGEYGYGTVFKVGPASETTLYSFTGGSDGCTPTAGIILDTSGNVYGVTNDGGAGFCNSGYGVVFEVDTAGNETVLHTFDGGNGSNPNAQLFFDSKGNLYGMTENGGTSGVCQGGCGTVFEVSPGQNGTWSEKVLYSFCSTGGCADGDDPARGPLVIDADGNLYGTTEAGGDSQNCNGGCGVVFKLDTAGNETVLHSFTGGADGAVPFAGLTIGSAGTLYGAASAGGDLKCADGSDGFGCGVVFKMTP